MQTRDVAAARSTRAVADRTMGTGALDRVSSGVLEAGRDVSGSGAGMWRKSISCTLAGVMIAGTAGLVVLGHQQPMRHSLLEMLQRRRLAALMSYACFSFLCRVAREHTQGSAERNQFCRRLGLFGPIPSRCE